MDSSVRSEGVDGGDGLESDLPEWERERLEKVSRLRKAGVELYSRSFEGRTPLGEIAGRYAGLEVGETAEGSSCRVAGRVMARRVHGKAVFLTLRDGWGYDLVGFLDYDLVFGKERYREAIDTFEEIIRTEPDYVARHPEIFYYLGRSHDSSAIHEQVIRELEDAGPDCPALEALRGTAPRSRDALLAGSFDRPPPPAVRDRLSPEARPLAFASVRIKP